jgi:putative ABC transport system substrate-binding protein
MKRREFISLVGGTVVAWPRAVIAQVSPRRALVAVLSTGSSAPIAHFLTGFSQGLQELGYVEGQNIDIVYRYADGDQERIPLLADELVRLKPNVIIVTGSTDAVLAVKQATATIPIVSTVLSESAALVGLVESQAEDRNNVEHRSRTHTVWQQEAKAAANALGVTLVPVNIRTANDLAVGFQTFVRERVELVLLLGDALVMSERRQIADLAAAARLPSMYSYREYAVAGGLISYGINLRENNRRAAAYVDKILKGSKPGDLPVEFPTKLEMVINLKTPKALALTIPQSILLRADEVIEYRQPLYSRLAASAHVSSWRSLAMAGLPARMSVGESTAAVARP